MNKSVVVVSPDVGELYPEPIPQNWVLSGAPRAWSKVTLRSRDWVSRIVVWECTAGSFKWHYRREEFLKVVSGEAYMIVKRGPERRFGPGDVLFFPAGSSCTWRVPQSFRKIAMLREPLWPPLGLCLTIWNKFLHELTAFAQRGIQNFWPGASKPRQQKRLPVCVRQSPTVSTLPKR